MSVAPAPAETRRVRDIGSALPLVLVLMVIGSLIVIPTLTYAVSVMRHNTALSEKTQRNEAVRAGLRIALADPVKLYEACRLAGENSQVTLASPPDFVVDVTTKCFSIGSATARDDDELRQGAVSTRVGQTLPAMLQGLPDPVRVWGVPTDWQAEATENSETGKIWLPNLPVHGLNVRSPDGTQMPAGFATCTVYFPGAYPDALVLDGPTFFTSGVYYFESEVRVQGGASVVVGGGATPGCTTDQEAIFYAENVPGTHNMTGLGATWVLGANGRVVVTNDAALSLHFNKRYVEEDDLGGLSAADVSIMTVNGAVAADGVTGIDLAADGLEVPLSLAGADALPATGQGYVPSRITPVPAAPAAPGPVTAQVFSGSAVVSWTAPAVDGGSPITGYTATASSGGLCSTTGRTSCVIRSLVNGVPTTFTVIASNAHGSSPSSAASTAISPGGSSLAVPARPAQPIVTVGPGVARVAWVPVAAGAAPIGSYTVSASPGGATCSVDMTTAVAPTTVCDVIDLDPVLTYTFTVVANNAVGSSSTSPPSTSAVPAASNPVLAPLPVTTLTASELPSVVSFELAGPGAATVEVPGYVAVPQGRIKIDNPAGWPIAVRGGILAAEFSVVDARTAPIPVGFEKLEVQHTLRIVSTNAEGPETSTAIVQVNQNGGNAVNSWEVQ